MNALSAAHTEGHEPRLDDLGELRIPPVHTDAGIHTDMTIPPNPGANQQDIRYNENSFQLGQLCLLLVIHHGMLDQLLETQFPCLYLLKA